MKKKYMWAVILAVYICFIFSNSMIPSEASSKESGAVLSMVRQVLDYVGVNPMAVSEHMVRKTAHVLEYTLLGILIPCSLLNFKCSRREWMMSVLIIGAAVPFTDETIQLFVTGRSGQISDVWLDMSGVLAGILLIWIYRRLWHLKMQGE